MVIVNILLKTTIGHARKYFKKYFSYRQTATHFPGVRTVLIRWNCNLGFGGGSKVKDDLVFHEKNTVSDLPLCSCNLIWTPISAAALNLEQKCNVMQFHNRRIEKLSQNVVTILILTFEYFYYYYYSMCLCTRCNDDVSVIAQFKEPEVASWIGRGMNRPLKIAR
jgi:hypothetical protein